MPGAYLYGFDETTGEPVRCRVTAEGKLIINAASIVENPPVENETKKAPTSEWAFDHDADPAAHHAKYTHVESRAAIGDLLTNLGRLTKTLYCEYQRIERLNLFNIQYSAASTHYASIKSTLNSASIRIQGREIGIGYPNTTLRLWDGAAYQYVQTLPQVNALIATHTDIAAAHHAKYTDLEATESFKNRAVTFYYGIHDSTDMTNYSMAYLNSGSGDIDIRGLVGGSNGKIIIFVRGDVTNAVFIRHLHGTPDVGNQILTPDGTDQTLAAGSYGGFMFVYLDSYWRLIYDIP